MSSCRIQMNFIYLISKIKLGHYNLPSMLHLPLILTDLACMVIRWSLAWAILSMTIMLIFIPWILIHLHGKPFSMFKNHRNILNLEYKHLLIFTKIRYSSMEARMLIILMEIYGHLIFKPILILWFICILKCKIGLVMPQLFIKIGYICLEELEGSPMKRTIWLS